MLTAKNLNPALLPGITAPTNDSADEPAEEQERSFRPPALVPGSTTAKALYQVLLGTPTIVVSSPPGAGKTTLISHVVSHLWDVTDMTIGVAAVSHPAVNEICGRIAQLTGPDTVRKATGKAKRGTLPLPEFVTELTPGEAAKRRVVGRVAKSWQYSPDRLDLLVVDEAWQLTYSDLTAVAHGASQLLLIGDPGQIQPIVRGAAHHWPGWDSPAAPGPEVMAQRDDAVTLTMPTTFRLGPDSVKAIAPLYDFTFESARPDRSVLRPDGSPYPELVSKQVPADTTVVELGRALADTAVSFAGATITGFPGKDTIDYDDIAICVARNATVAATVAALAQAGVPANVAGGITVGTANSLQGGQWNLVIALDPAHGQSTISSHSGDIGRLCVMASRHLSTLVWVSDENWRSLFSGSSLPSADVHRHLACRMTLTANPISAGSVTDSADSVTSTAVAPDDPA